MKDDYKSERSDIVAYLRRKMFLMERAADTNGRLSPQAKEHLYIIAGALKAVSEDIEAGQHGSVGLN